MEFTRAEIKSYYAVRAPGLTFAGEKEARGPCVVHGGTDPNFGVNVETGLAHCHSRCGRGWDILSLEMELAGCTFTAAKTEVFRLVGRAAPNWQEREIEATFDYTDERGKVLYQVVRKFGKHFSQRRPFDGAGNWTWGLGGIAPVPFGLPQVIAAQTVGICEGEKDVLALPRAGWAATCNNGGAGNFKAELAPWFAGKSIAIFPDNDEPGRKHAESVAKILQPVAKSVRIVELPEKGDVSDFLATGKTGADLLALYAAAQDWTPEWRWDFNVPHANDRYVRTVGAAVDDAGGYEPFWRSLEIEGLPTPFSELTHALGGLHDGEVYVLGANQGAGKTSMMLQFAIAALEANAGVLVFSMEMGHRDIFQRMIAIDAHVELSQYRSLSKFHRDSPMFQELDDALRKATAKLSRAPLRVSTKSGVTPEFLLEESLRLKASAKVGMVIVDHMQLMGAVEKTRSDYEKFTAISRATKEIAMELQVPLLLVSQTSRANSFDKRSELEVSDLRGSGAIEEDAAAVLLMYYDAKDYAAAKLEEAEKTSERLTKGPIRTCLRVAKNRYGPTGQHLDLWHYRAATRFAVIGEQ